MEPDYSTYKTSELEETLSLIDKNQFPERAARLEQELVNRRRAEEQQCEKAFDATNLPEKFYACPSCGKKIGIFSKAMNKWGKIKHCSRCGEPFTTKLNLKFFFLMIIPVLALSFLVIRPIVLAVGLSPGISTGITCGLLVFLSLRIKAVSTKPAPE